MSQKRQYDIGGNVLIEDDGRYLQARHVRDDKCSESIGVRRPPLGEPPAEYRVQVSENGQLFYLLDYSDVHGFWLGKATFSLRDDVDVPKNVDHVKFEHRPARLYGRVYCPFAFYSVRANGVTEHWPGTDEAVQDYLLLDKREQDRQELRFNRLIAHTGRDLRWIMTKLGAWVPFPPEPPPVVLTD